MIHYQNSGTHQRTQEHSLARIHTAPQTAPHSIAQIPHGRYTVSGTAHSSLVLYENTHRVSSYAVPRLMVRLPPYFIAKNNELSQGKTEFEGIRNNYRAVLYLLLVSLKKYSSIYLTIFKQEVPFPYGLFALLIS